MVIKIKIDLNELLENDLKNKRTKPNDLDSIYASGLGYCLRKQYYDKLYTEEPDIDLQKIFNVGNLVHDYLDELLRQSGYTVLAEQPLIMYIPHLDLRISGRFDNLVIDDEGNSYLFEHKSASSIKYLKEPKKEHIYQLHVYMKCLNLKEGYIVYLEKNSSHIKQFKVEFDKKILDEAIERAKIVKIALNNGVVPINEAEKNSKTSWQCDYCRHRDMCVKETYKC